MRIRRQGSLRRPVYMWLVPALLIIMMLFGAFVTPTVRAQEPPPPKPVNDYQSTTGPKPPPGVAIGGESVALAGATIISGVPSYIWHHGCGPTAAGMVIGYWDAQGYDDLVSGSATIQTSAVDEMIASTGHYNDYALPMDYAPAPIQPDKSEPPAGDEHPSNSLGDFMRTSWSAWGNYYGWSWLSDMPASLMAYTQSRLTSHIGVAENYIINEFTWAQYKAEIDAGRPMVLLVDTDSNGGTDHFVTAIGYNDDGGTPQYGFYNTWDNDIHWFDWQPIANGQPWGVLGITTFRLEPAPPPITNDDIATAREVDTLPYTYMQDTTRATSDLDDPTLTCGPGTSGHYTVWYRFEPTVSGLATINTNGSTYDTVLAVWRGSPDALAAVACDDDSGEDTRSELSFFAEPGQTYYIEISGFSSGSTGTLNLSVTFDERMFPDVPTPTKEWMEPWIENFYEAGITTGCAQDPLAYCPEREVTRAEMAVFILRALNYPALPHDPPDVSGTFDDMPVVGKEWMEEWVEEFYDLGITTGCSQVPLEYCPEREVTRAEMAVFILRALYGESYEPPAASGTFADVPVPGKEWMEPWIEQFYADGITTGCGTDAGGNPIFCPEQEVTRAEMAVFILRAFEDIPSPET